jgi:hypothetical protein
MFSGGSAEATAKQVKLTETPLKAFKLMLSYIYSGKLVIQEPLESSNLLWGILRLAHLYQLDAVVSSVVEHMSRTVTRDTVIPYLEVADIFGLQNIEQLCWSWLDENFCEPHMTPPLHSVSEVRTNSRRRV